MYIAVVSDSKKNPKQLQSGTYCAPALELLPYQLGVAFALQELHQCSSRLHFHTMKAALSSTPSMSGISPNAPAPAQTAKCATGQDLSAFVANYK